MGQAKKEWGRLQALAGEAEHICVEAGVLEQCEFHEDQVTIADADEDAWELAFRIGSRRWREGETSARSHRELMGAIKAAPSDAGIECYDCTKWEAA